MDKTTLYPVFYLHFTGSEKCSIFNLWKWNGGILITVVIVLVRIVIGIVIIVSLKVNYGHFMTYHCHRLVNYCYFVKILSDIYRCVLYKTHDPVSQVKVILISVNNYLYMWLAVMTYDLILLWSVILKGQILNMSAFCRWQG